MGHAKRIERRPGYGPSAPRALLVLALVLAGCASTDIRNGAVHDDEIDRTVRHTVEAGDRLAVIARDVTGDMETWRTIAEHNGIDDPRNLAIGTVLEIPGSLIPRDDTAPVAAATPEATPVSESPTPTGLAIATAEERAAPVVVTPVVSNRNFELAPLDQASDDRYSAERFVKVVGTYYPIAIYAEPEGYSRLLVRVTPGTVLPLEREIGDWLRVTTGAGTGYLRSTDGDILSTRDRSAGLSD